MADEEPSFFARICCCSSRDTKQPSVTLISNGAPKQANGVAVMTNLDDLPQTSISPARGTIDELVDNQSEGSNQESEASKTDAAKTTKAPRWRAETEDLDDMDEEINMNDVMVSELCEQEEEEQEQKVEDAISIQTNVVEEVDEEELQKLSKPQQNELKPIELDYDKKNKDEEKGEEKGEEQTSSRSREFVTFATMLQEGYESPRQAEVVKEKEEEGEGKEEAEKHSEKEEDSEDEEKDDEEVEEQKPESVATRLSKEEERKEPPSIEVTTVETEDDDSDLDEIMVDEVPLPDVSPPQPMPRSPQPRATSTPKESPEEERRVMGSSVEVNNSPPRNRSMMYAQLSSDEEESSDDEAEREVLPPVAKMEEDKTDVEDNWEDRSEKENRVTRLSLKSNGQATMTTGAVRVKLDSVDLTDDEFSEKMI